MNYLIKGSLFAAVFLASVFSQAAIFGTYNDEGNLFRSHLNNHLSEDLVAKFKDKVDSKDGVLICWSRHVYYKSIISMKKV